MTYKTMCQAIVAFIKERDPMADITPRQVFEMDPRGELWPVHALYDECVRRGMQVPEDQ